MDVEHVFLRKIKHARDERNQRMASFQCIYTLMRNSSNGIELSKPKPQL